MSHPTNYNITALPKYGDSNVKNRAVAERVYLPRVVRRRGRGLFMAAAGALWAGKGHPRPALNLPPNSPANSPTK